VDGDLRDFFGSVDHEKLLMLVAQRVADGRVLRLMQAMLTAGSYGKGRLLAIAAPQLVLGVPDAIGPILLAIAGGASEIVASLLEHGSQHVVGAIAKLGRFIGEVGWVDSAHRESPKVRYKFGITERVETRGKFQ
jgi:hypothetical protein